MARSLKVGERLSRERAEAMDKKESLKLYVLGCRLMDNTVKNATLAKIIALFNSCRGFCADNSIFNIGPVSVGIIYIGTLEGDPARRLAVDLHMTSPRDLSAEYDPAFLLDLAQGYSMIVRKQPAGWSLKPELGNYMS